MWLDIGVILLLDEPFGLGLAAAMHNSKPDDRHCTISFGYGLPVTATKLGYLRAALAV